MPSTSAALLLRALVLCTIHTAITAIAVVPSLCIIAREFCAALQLVARELY